MRFENGKSVRARICSLKFIRLISQNTDNSAFIGKWDSLRFLYHWNKYCFFQCGFPNRWKCVMQHSRFPRQSWQLWHAFRLWTGFRNPSRLRDTLYITCIIYTFQLTRHPDLTAWIIVLFFGGATNPCCETELSDFLSANNSRIVFPTEELYDSGKSLIKTSILHLSLVNRSSRTNATVALSMQIILQRNNLAASNISLHTLFSSFILIFYGSLCWTKDDALENSLIFSNFAQIRDVLFKPVDSLNCCTKIIPFTIILMSKSINLYLVK